MTRRFRLVAGPNGSGKSTLMHRLAEDYAVNFYGVLNADDIFAEVSRTGAFSPRIPVEPDALRDYAEGSSYDDEVKEFFRSGTIAVSAGSVRFGRPEAVNSYTVALVTNFLQDQHIRQGVSFSQETVFSHPSKVEALRAARAAGFRIYLYFVATDSPSINVSRVANRHQSGGHDVPAEKVRARFFRSLSQVKDALPFLSRAYFFDNSGDTMRYLAQWNADEGWCLALASEADAPAWFGSILAETAKRPPNLL